MIMKEKLKNIWGKKKLEILENGQILWKNDDDGTWIN